MLRYNLYPSRNDRPLNKWLLVASNLFIFLIAIGMLNLRMKDVSQPKNAPQVSESSLIPVEMVLQEVRTQVLEPPRSLKAKPVSACQSKDVW